MRILYIFPHPDDESFGPAPVLKRQSQQGHDVFLLTLTRGGATKVRHKLGYSIEEMGEVRFREMLKVEKLLALKGMTVLNLPDSGLQEMDPRKIEEIVADHIREIEPQVVGTYPVHGVSGFHDHLVTHAVVKRVFLEMKDSGATYLKRLAFLTVPNRSEEPVVQGNFILKQSDASLIDCEVLLDESDRKVLIDSLGCYESYREVIEKSGVIERIGDRIYFEIYGEDYKPVLNELTAGIV